MKAQLFTLKLPEDQMWGMLSDLEGHNDEYGCDYGALVNVRKAIVNYCIRQGYICEEGYRDGHIVNKEGKSLNQCICISSNRCKMRRSTKSRTSRTATTSRAPK